MNDIILLDKILQELEALRTQYKELVDTLFVTNCLVHTLQEQNTNLKIENEALEIELDEERYQTHYFNWVR